MSYVISERIAHWLSIILSLICFCFDFELVCLPHMLVVFSSAYTCIPLSAFAGFDIALVGFIFLTLATLAIIKKKKTKK